MNTVFSPNFTSKFLTPYFYKTMREIIVRVTVILAALVIGFLAPSFGMFTLFGAGGALFFVIVLIYGVQTFWLYIIFLFLGYFFAGRGFAYVGAYPIYVGEIGLLFGIFCIALVPFSNKIKLKFNFIWPPTVAILFFIAIHFFQTIPYFTTYKFDTIRDAMMYLYAIYALLIAVLVPREWIVQFIEDFGKYVLLFLLWAPFVYVFMEVVAFPFRFPGSPTPLVSVKFGMMGVHLGGAGAFLLLRLDKKEHPIKDYVIWILWIMWSVNWLLFGSSNRAGMLSALAGVGLTVLFWPRSSLHRPIILAIILIWFLLVTGAYSDFSIPTSKGREISAQQMIDNMASIFFSGSNEADESLNNTAEWRMNWWSDIVDYTVNGPYFWNGKGYGINLAVDDGYAVDRQLRSPHNSHLHYLARAGVPGFAAWILVLVTYYGTMIFIFLKRRATNPWDARFAVWLIAYTAAFLINAGFDLVMESPFAAIEFWALIGISLVYFAKPTGVKPDTEKPQLVAEGL